jgi:ABC-type phosphate/phosphonate transport system substrate-binding protein
LAASLIREANAQPLFIIEEPEPSYQRSVIIVRESDTASDPGDLSGHCLAFARHGSGLGHLLPHSMLLSYGLKVVETAEDADIHDDHVAVHHINDDLSPLFWLYRSDDVPRAAAVTMRDFSKIERVRPELFRPISASKPIPIAVVIAAADVDVASRSMLTERLEQE